MDLATITAIQAELESELIGRRFGKIFQLSKDAIAIDFRLADSRYLFLSIERKNPRTYLIRRKLRDLEKASGTPGSFSLILRKKLSGAELTSISQVETERVLLFEFVAEDEMANASSFTLAAQLTGASANVFLLDAHSTIVEAMRQTRGTGQQIGERYAPPERTKPSTERAAVLHSDSPVSLSAQLDIDDQAQSESAAFQSIAASARSKLKQEVTKREKLLKKLDADLAGHGDAEKWKRYGDLLLANAATAKRRGEIVSVIDYFDDTAPELEIPVDENDSITAAAEKFFKRYTKARNASQEIERRVGTVTNELKGLRARQTDLESAIEAGDEEKINEIAGIRKQSAVVKTSAKRSESLSGTRSFVSSDGFEILVGKKAKDNDFLTFRIAKSLDTWMHAADYPGSHVVVRNPNRKEIPHRTLLEAAQLAAFYSQGKSQPKAAVHYTQKKFVNKPKGAAAGLVSLASFKTLLVQPKIEVEKKV